MSVKVCGHLVRWQKPIKIYALFRMLTLLLALGSFFVSTSLVAAELPRNSEQASSGGSAPCLPQASCMKNAPTKQAVPARTQRSAGSSSSVSAMALIMALGMTSVAGPTERSAKPALKPSSSVSDAKALRLPADQFPTREQPRIALEQ